MLKPRGLVVLIPSAEWGTKEFVDSGLERKLTGEGYITVSPSTEPSSESWSGLYRYITELLRSRPGERLGLIGASVSGTAVIRLMIENHENIVAGVAVSPVFAEELKYSLSRIEKPLLIVNGSGDDESRLKDGRKYHDLIEGSLHRVIRNSGRFPHLDHPERFLILLKKFLDDEL